MCKIPYEKCKRRELYTKRQPESEDFSGCLWVQDNFYKYLKCRVRTTQQII
nr:hypothetical protein [Alysiella crassa]UOP07021.1 hypothetical protein LVJ80_00575 [Alysiella crassa]